MDEEISYLMLQARMAALEQIAIQEIGGAFAGNGFPKTEAELRVFLERAVEARAPGCGHFPGGK